MFYYKRSKKFGYDESITANTVFYGVKIPKLKAFHMIFRVTSKKKGMSAIELGTEVGVKQKTAYLFKRKVQALMNIDNNDKLNGEVDIDETIIRCFSSSVGSSTETKEALELLPDRRTGNLSLEHIESFKVDELNLPYKNGFK